MFETRKNPGALAFFVAVALLGAAAACSSSKSPSVVRSPTLTTSTSVQSSSSSAASGGAGKGAPSATITPAAGLKSGQVVQVNGSGFSPNEGLVINECANKGAATGPGDCNLAGLVPTMSDSTGKVSAQFTVTTGPFGANHIVCSATQVCLLSVSQPSPSPTEEADVPLQFG